MNNSEPKKKAFLLGIGGIGVSALAQYLHAQGFHISGSSNSDNEQISFLREEIHAEIAIGHSADYINDEIDLLVYSPAVPYDNPERERARELEIDQFSYPEYLGEISKKKKTIAIAGTNGKTTTTSMIATIADSAGLDPTVIVGGIMPRFNSNCRIGHSDLFIVEACEYKQSFLSINPDILVVTNITHDHLDYFGSVEAYKKIFIDFLDNIKKGGVMVIDGDEKNNEGIIRVAKEKGIRIINCSGMMQDNWQLSVPGIYNIENAACASAVGKLLGVVDPKSILEEEFITSKRRFEYVGSTDTGTDIYDDYAHNAEAVERVISGAKERFQDKKIVLIFQPHMYSRTEEMKDEYEKILVRCDELFMLPIYPAREIKADFNIESTDIIESMSKGIFCESVEACAALVNERKFGSDYIIITMGAGATDILAKKLIS